MQQNGRIFEKHVEKSHIYEYGLKNGPAGVEKIDISKI